MLKSYLIYNLKSLKLGLMALFLILYSNVYSQSILGELIFGANVSQVDGDEVVGYRKPGLNIGVGAALPFGNNWYVSLETVFSQKGAYKKFPPNAITPLPYYDLRLNYAEVPLLIHYNDRDQVTAGVGFSYNRLVSMTEIEHGAKVNWQKNNIPYNKDDYEVLLDIRFRVYERLHFNFRYAYSMAKIRTRIFDNSVSVWKREQYNNLLSFRFIYLFNEKYEPKIKK